MEKGKTTVAYSNNNEKEQKVKEVEQDIKRLEKDFD